MEVILQMELLARAHLNEAAQEWIQLLPGLLLRMCRAPASYLLQIESSARLATHPKHLSDWKKILQLSTFLSNVKHKARHLASACISSAASDGFSCLSLTFCMSFACSRLRSSIYTAQ